VEELFSSARLALVRVGACSATLRVRQAGGRQRACYAAHWTAFVHYAFGGTRLQDVPRLCPAARSLRAAALFCAWVLLDGCAYDWAIANDGTDAEAGLTTSDGAASDQEHDGSLEITDVDLGTSAHDAAIVEPEPDARAQSADASVTTLFDASSAGDAGADGQGADGSSADSSVNDASTVMYVPDTQRLDAAPGALSCAHLNAAFCTDFEDGSLDVFSWHEVTPNTQASVSLVDAGAAAGGLAFRSATAGTADESARVVVRLLDGAPSSFRTSFDFLPSLSLPAEGDELVSWFRLTEQSGAAYAGVYLGSRRDGTFLVIHNLDGANESFDLHRVADLPTGWVRVDLELALGHEGSATLRFDGALALAYSGPIQVTNVTLSFVQLGLYASQAPASSALYDNVVVDFAP
jgi:hypothetical protein